MLLLCNSIVQVKAWFANKRNRTLNTRPKRQQMRMKQQLQEQQLQQDQLQQQQHNLQSMIVDSSYESSYMVYG